VDEVASRVRPLASSASLITRQAAVNLFEDYQKAAPTYDSQAAIQLFTKNELGILCGFFNDGVDLEDADVASNLQTVLVGQWNAHPDEGLYVRFGVKWSDVRMGLGHGISLSKGSGGSRWTYNWRHDLIGTTYGEPGLLRVEQNIGLSETKYIAEVASKFTEALEGYFSVINARKSIGALPERD
ncbi:MAG TPA: hypothetical protein VI387_06605, partial [Candidatus Brocadiales bacterium]|nr:hypothetical protein [Candidatus Brocadiales bacterium]